MSTISVEGHAANNANFKNLANIVISFGDTYNPSKERIKLITLQAMQASAANLSQIVNTAESETDSARSAREQSFGILNTLTTRINNAVKASDAEPKLVDNIGSIIRQIKGIRATPKMTDEEKKVAIAAGDSGKEISAAHTDFVSDLQNMDKLNKLLAVTKGYAPNEADLQLPSLVALQADLNEKHDTAELAIIALKQARDNRDSLFYTDNSGLVDVAAEVKIYTKSVYGASSIQYKALSKLKFRKPKK